MTTTEREPGRPSRRGPKYYVDIQGTDHEWGHAAISVREIRALGNLTTSDPIVEVDLDDNSERTLDEDEVVELKPGRGFARKVRFQRG